MPENRWCVVCQAAGASLMLLVSNTSDCLVMSASDESAAANLTALYAVSVDADVTPTLFLSTAIRWDLPLLISAHPCPPLTCVSPVAQTGEYLRAAVVSEPGVRVVLWGVAAEMDANAALLWLLAVATVAAGSVLSARDAMAQLAPSEGLSVRRHQPAPLALERHANTPCKRWPTGAISSGDAQLARSLGAVWRLPA